MSPQDVIIVAVVLAAAAFVARSMWSSLAGRCHCSHAGTCRVRTASSPEAQSVGTTHRPFVSIDQIGITGVDSSVKE